MGHACSATATSLINDLPGEICTSTDAKTIATVQAHLDRCLYWSGGLPFEKHQPIMLDAARKTLYQVADILSRYPALGLKIVGYTGEMPESQALHLSHLRSLAVRDVLYEAGCHNILAAKGMGFADNNGPRIELIPCDPFEAHAFLAEVAALERTLKNFAADRGASCTSRRQCTTCPVQ